MSESGEKHNTEQSVNGSPEMNPLPSEQLETLNIDNEHIVSARRPFTDTIVNEKRRHDDENDVEINHDETPQSATNRIPAQATRPTFSRHSVDDGLKSLGDDESGEMFNDYDRDSSSVLITEVKGDSGLVSLDWSGVDILTERAKVRRDLEQELAEQEENEADWDTDLEMEDEVHEHDPTGRTAYRRACDDMGVIPASYFSRHITEPEITMKFHGLGPMGAKAIAQVLKNNITLEKLNLSGNWIEAEGGAYMALMLQENDYITTLCLADNKLGGMGAYHMCKVLHVNTALRSLDLSGNEFGDKEAELFAEVLDGNKFLKELVLSRNGFGSYAGEILGPALAANDIMENIDLSWNQIRGVGAVAIGRGIKENVRLKTCNLSWNGLGLSGGKAIADALVTNDSLLELDISGNRLDIDVACHIAKALKVNESLRTLKMGNNPISTTGAVAIVGALDSNDSSLLEHLDLADIPVEFEYVRVVQDIQQKRSFTETHGMEIRSGNTTQDIGKMGVDPKKKPDPVMVLSQHIVVNDTRILDLLRQHESSLYVTRQQFESALQELGVEFDKNQMEDLVKALDKMNDGRIHYGDLVKQAESNQARKEPTAS